MLNTEMQSPAIRLTDGLRDHFERVRREQLQRLVGSLDDLTPEQFDTVEAMTVSMMNALLRTSALHFDKLSAHRPD